jgi:hypothetical protein
MQQFDHSSSVIGGGDARTRGRDDLPERRLDKRASEHRREEQANRPSNQALSVGHEFLHFFDEIGNDETKGPLSCRKIPRLRMCAYVSDCLIS